MDKKALSSIVGILFLLIIMLLATFSLFNFYKSSSSELKADLEEENRLLDFIDIKYIEAGKIYYINSYSQEIAYLNLSILGEDCSFNGSFVKGSGVIILNDCYLSNSYGKYDIIIRTSNFYKIESVLNKNFYPGASTLPLNCSTFLGGNWSQVPGDIGLGTSDFCVMKYEARWNGSGAIHSGINNYCGNGNDDGTNNCLIDGSVGVVSKNEDRPLTQVNMYEAKALCQRLGDGFDLISNNEWMTIARNVQYVDENWDGGSVGTGCLMKGNTAQWNSCSYNGGGITSTTTNNTSRLYLSNNEEVWDMSGNAWEWTSTYVNCSSTGHPCSGLPADSTPNTDEYLTFDTIIDFGQFSAIEMLPYNTTIPYSNGIGRVRVDHINSAFPSANYVFGMIRGGYATTSGGEKGGIFTMNLDNSPLFSVNAIGFRCTYTP